MLGCCSYKKIELLVLGYGKNRYKKEIKKKKKNRMRMKLDSKDKVE